MNKPNIVFILIDDMGWRDLGSFGSSFYETPHIDRLARNGMSFSDAYASCPVCSPTRASIMTGKYPAHVGITDWIDHGNFHPMKGKLVDVPYLKSLPPEEYCLAQALQDGGYATWHVGKWHLGKKGAYPEDFGFEINIGGCDMGSPGANGYFSPWSVKGLEHASVPDGTDLTDYLTDEAIHLICTKEDRPFFLNLCHYTVHTPIQANPDKIRKYEEKARALGLDILETFEEGGFHPTERKADERIRRRLLQSDPAYAAMIETLDDNVGRLVDALEASDELENTLIVFTSDNGGLATAEGSPTCNAPLAEGKGWMYEGGCRVPLFAVWPQQIRAGSRCDVPVTSTDFYPTFLDCAGLPAKPEQHSDGVSLLPLFQGADGLDREAIFWHYPHYGNQGGTPGSSIRMGDYKLIEFFEDGRIELYQLSDDPGENHNLADTELERANALRKRLHEWRDSIEAKIPQPNPDWREAAISNRR
ncbi:sulfatase [Puniceicoccus vermicola]|uniref:Sulfatase n=1 Tax=Puniceicoccus vermicola TaxID=388746 RepID=A0A7X1B0C6_9BACT|nr:sulfatase [Puniceicoccus vermicola]MBC2603237.1 sulfatase [Puniceicoccus vermicola]